MFEHPIGSVPKDRDMLERDRNARIANGPRSDTPLRDLVCNLEDRCKALHAGCDALEERLDTALRPVPPAVATARTGTTATEAPESHLVGRLRMLNDGFIALEQKLQFLHSRIEI